MLYYNFKNYEEFNALFGIVKHGNNSESRKNKILLAYLKDKKLLHQAVAGNDYTFLHIGDMTELEKRMEKEIIRSGTEDAGLPYELRLINPRPTIVLLMQRMNTWDYARTEIPRPSDTITIKPPVSSR